MLTNKKLIITGAASGIGKEIVKLGLREGASVIACDINGRLLEELKQSTDACQNLHTYQVDVSDYDQVRDFFAYIEQEHPDADSLVNNAGIYLARSILDYQEDEIARVMDINIKGAVYFSQLFGRRMLRNQRRGTIVNLSSVSGMEGSSDAIYGMTKAALLGLTKSCAMNFSPYIRVNAVAPTMVDTSMMETIPEWRKQEYLSHQLIPVPVLPEDVAETVVFLLSDKSKHYTGATFDINNGGYLR
ncbi:3-oxoacyl-[acyl-carrier protein] reductase [Paenibacillus sophorae]|uniref:3-oxoacyl-[acyl-carrier protein] reductase n=1 Tax=Paenibacillus sophorae TaxID=1333845 RepID=A0A1H8U4E3_9BACL|nr:SDR family oxidoreductase [Paenibacillus sophorae]QWU17940.1 SDR family oxidoreductase [Paenibacillus sophorae]SEO98015.1 3-oxoacyl-[acyl-carrier protein] reductase [Paenibacillus sophorae]